MDDPADAAAARLLAGAEIEAITFVRDYLQVSLFASGASFLLTVLSRLTVRSPAGEIVDGQSVPAALIATIDSRVTNVEIDPRTGIALALSTGSSIEVSFSRRGSDRPGGRNARWSGSRVVGLATG